MQADRRDFMKVVAGAIVMQTPNPKSRTANPGPLKALVFDAYGTLFDVFSVTSLCEQLFPGNGMALAALWRV